MHRKSAVKNLASRKSAEKNRLPADRAKKIRLTGLGLPSTDHTDFSQEDT